MRTLLITLLLSFVVLSVNANDIDSSISYEEIITKINDINIAKKNNLRVKEIIKEYTYNVGDDDSKNDARKNALSQVKVLILEETGVFVESYLELDNLRSDNGSKQIIREEIKNLTAGIVKTKILDEKYDGETFYIKASVLVDPDSVSEGISEILKIRANQGEIDKLQKLLQTKESEIDIRSNETIALQKKLTKQMLTNEAKEKEISRLNQLLSNAKTSLNEYQKDEKKIQKELTEVTNKIEQIKDRINKQNKKACLVPKGAKKYEIVNTIGEPDDVQGCFQGYSQRYKDHCEKWYYGSILLDFDETKLLKYVLGCKK
ncbi:hypothetical protein Dacet_0725 [Denitrovibrio acetiphilus DSM 12809]|uniref:Uncharacterized protein n=1 Tax=Denitrovibrio acetiphilus (strain DSM 12809 / NBRC 114555 / N2460) TaxID=522772 RepID=D4H4W5_DENA2|nr:hypothetical protein [Denitrovibrio acetiphilus]ADD67509.1 hypothetical protein Dacet_0725 [Denitrovibrio acetiphilus DSM 12809]